MFVTKEYDTPILLCRLWFVCLLRKNLAHYFMAASFFSLRENPAQCFMSGLFVCLLRKNLANIFFSGLFACLLVREIQNTFVSVIERSTQASILMTISWICRIN